MTNKILKAILLAAITVLVASLLMITGVLYGYFGNLQQSQLKDELSLAAEGTEQLGDAYLKELEESSYRLTWVNADGDVLYDSRANAEEMENHRDREEIREALKNGTGSSSRYSTTLTEKYIYEAMRLKDGTVLRISESRVTAVVLVLRMLQPIGLILSIAIVLSVCLSKSMAKRIVEPLNRLNLDQPMENDAYEELAPLLRRIHIQQEEISGQLHTLRRKQDEFDQITGNMKEMLVLLDDTGRVISINPAAEVWFETTKSAGKDFLMVYRKQNMQAAIQQAKEEGFSSLRQEKNGRQYQFELNSIDSQGSVVGIVLLGFDITEQLNAEKNRREFTANVSHELKTPLQSIIGSTELLENGIVKEEDIPRFVGHIRKEASRLVCLIEDIIRLSQLDEGAQMPWEEVSLGALAEEVCETLSDVAREKEVSVEVQGERGQLLGVRRLLYEIVYNLCDNAIKYNHVGGSVKIAVEDLESSVRLQVMDNGLGIPVTEQEKVFQRFYRVDKSHSKKSGGTGLGLSIVKHGVQYHHGTIHMESAPGQGTRIEVVFPKGQQAPEETLQ